MIKIAQENQQVSSLLYKATRGKFISEEINRLKRNFSLSLRKELYINKD